MCSFWLPVQRKMREEEGLPAGARAHLVLSGRAEGERDKLTMPYSSRLLFPFRRLFRAHAPKCTLRDCPSPPRALAVCPPLSGEGRGLAAAAAARASARIALAVDARCCYWCR